VASPKIRLLIVDDQRLFADALRTVIESRAKDFDVVDVAENGQDAIEKTQLHRPDVVVMDVRMPVMDGVQATRIIHERFPATKILILTTFEDDQYVKFSLQGGAIGYLLKSRSADQLISSIRALSVGTVQIDPAVAKKVMMQPGDGGGGNISSDELTDRLRMLSPRELDVLRLLIEAKDVRHIAASLQIAEQTVRNHTSNIYFKLGIHKHIEVVRLISQIRFFLDHYPELLS
jgi:DNA-binding NarL/FixJ family response regulator